MIEVKHNLDKLLLALPKFVVATAQAVEDVVKASLRTKDLLKKRWTKVQLENLKLDLREAIFEPQGIRRAIAQFCNEPTWENWRTVQFHANNSSTISMGLSKFSGRRSVAREYAELVQQIEATLDDKNFKFYLGDRLEMPRDTESIAKLRELEPVYDRVNEALLEIQTKLTGHIAALEQQLESKIDPERQASRKSTLASQRDRKPNTTKARAAARKGRKKR
jgi:hypothetical protein